MVCNRLLGARTANAWRGLPCIRGGGHIVVLLFIAVPRRITGMGLVGHLGLDVIPLPDVLSAVRDTTAPKGLPHLLAPQTPDEKSTAVCGSAMYNRARAVVGAGKHGHASSQGLRLVMATGEWNLDRAREAWQRSVIRRDGWGRRRRPRAHTPRH